MRAAAASIHSGDFAQVGDMSSGGENTSGFNSWWSGAEDLRDDVRVLHRKRGHINYKPSPNHLPQSFLQPLELMQLRESDLIADLYCNDSYSRSVNAGSLFCLAAVGALHAVIPSAPGNLHYVPYAITRDTIRHHSAPAFRSFDLSHIVPRATVAAELVSADAAVAKGLSFSTLEGRVTELRAIADEEEIGFSEGSLSDLQQLFEIMPIGHSPLLFLLDNGNIRVSWRDSINRHASFELIGDGQAKPVIFSEEPGTAIRNQIYGVVSINSIPKLLEAAGLDKWIFAA